MSASASRPRADIASSCDSAARRDADGTIVLLPQSMDEALRNTEVGKVIRRNRRWIATAARLGFAAQALVYGTIGVLAGQYALGIGGRTTDTKGAIIEYGGGLVGGVLLVLMAIGFAGYAVWRMVQAIADTEDKGRELKGMFVRAGYFGGGLINGWLAIVAARVLTGERLGNDDAARSWTASFLELPFGAELVVLIGAGVIVYGAAQFQRAFGGEYRRHLETQRMNPEEQAMARRVSKTGLSTRGAIYILAGIFVISAALSSDPREAHDPGGVLAVVAGQPYGAILLAAIALGLLAYGGYAAFEAAYRRIR